MRLPGYNTLLPSTLEKRERRSTKKKKGDDKARTLTSVTIDDLDKTGKEILPMVLNLASKFHRPGGTVTREQLVSAGLLGVAQARAVWNPKAKCLLSTLAYHNIRGRMLDCLAAEYKHTARFVATDPVDMADMQAEPSSIEARVIHESLIKRVQAIITREFNDEQKNVLHWFMKGFSNEDIAAHLCVPTSAISAILDKSLEILRVRLGVKI